MLPAPGCNRYPDITNTSIAALQKPLASYKLDVIEKPHEQLQQPHLLKCCNPTTGITFNCRLQCHEKIIFALFYMLIFLISKVKTENHETKPFLSNNAMHHPVVKG
ncbi:hypothetical protein C7N43_30050 [Sphingobacteriales bacterium UPWRP_1]|nr:hypothetical protein B6N25_17100 [Sphingobacteriales bacterium TSM_CSS]PSJ73250.1 hypothetical protein C7N43_30050 [Sphingobacteriales bacterium UPWRP_1]